jgi:transcriptional regulator with XRE-family HTH domain
MADKDDSRLAIILLRSLHGWDQKELAEAAQVAASQVSVYETGGRAAPREFLEKVAAAAGFPPYLLDPLLRFLRSFRIAAQRRSRADRALAEGAAAELMELFRLTVDTILEPLTQEEAGDARPDVRDRELAAPLWTRLERRTAAERRLLVEEGKEYQSWSLCERVAAESAALAPKDPGKALELAELAVSIAERAPGEETWRSRLQGYAWGHMSQARRACGDLLGTEEALTRARKLWETGASGDPGLLDCAWIHDRSRDLATDPATSS